MNQEVVIKRNKWENDTKINHFTVPNFEEKPLSYRSFETTYIESILRVEDGALYDYLIFDEEVLIGECNISLDPPQLEKKIPGTAWVGLVIGEEEFRGKGIGKEVMEFLEYESKQLGATRIELGVFEFNKRAVRLYESMGYQKFTELDNFTFYDGKWHRDYRLEKFIK